MTIISGEFKQQRSFLTIVKKKKEILKCVVTRDTDYKYFIQF